MYSVLLYERTYELQYILVTSRVQRSRQNVMPGAYIATITDILSPAKSFKIFRSNAPRICKHCDLDYCTIAGVHTRHCPRESRQRKRRSQMGQTRSTIPGWRVRLGVIEQRRHTLAKPHSFFRRVRNVVVPWVVTS